MRFGEKQRVVKGLGALFSISVKLQGSFGGVSRRLGHLRVSGSFGLVIPRKPISYTTLKPS